MPYELIITEKPNAAKKIADALADGKPIKENQNGVPYYKITHGKSDIVVGCAVGHLYGLAEKEKKGWTYPVFDIEWKPAGQVNKDAKFSSKYLTVLKKLSKEAKDITVATDYDVEGEVIGLNVVRFACKRADARRMKFSTLTKDELREAYDHVSPRLDWGQATAGETRHMLDFYYGINLSRALTLAVKTTGKFKLMSTGRVQGPALKIIVDKEREIKAFKPTPYWQLELIGKVKGGEIDAWHKEDKFWEKEKAKKILDKVTGKKAFVDDVKKNQFKQQPPFPFDLTTLQTEAYRSLKIPPKDTLATAQNLYTDGLISYPRTSSQQLPESINYKKVLTELMRQEYYKGYAQKLLEKPGLKPNNGKKTDPAHPAIYPTGQIKSISGREAKVYDLIVRRFLSTFGEPAVRETAEIDIGIEGEIFIAKGTRTVEKGWFEMYGHHVKLEEEELPKVEKGEEVDVNKIVMHDKETQPPRRYTPASIIKDLEKRNLGTKATRSEIVDTLFKRGYVDGKSIEATDLGINLIEILEKNCPLIIDEELTRKFEDSMEEIREGKRKEDTVLEKAKQVLTEISEIFKKKEKIIGKELSAATIETRDKLSYIGQCPNCKEGVLQQRKGKFGRFIACNKYPECKTTFSLPNYGMVKALKKECEQCGYPLIQIIRKGKKPQQICINPNCPSKKIDEEEAKKEEKPCPKCKEGKMVLKKSVYGTFLACNRYPKCKNTESLKNGNGNGESNQS